MLLDAKAARLTLLIDTGEEADADELGRLTRQLRAEIQEMEVESVELVSDETLPEGAKSAEAVTLGALAVAVLPEAIPKLIDYLKSWVTRRDDRTIKIKTQVGDRSLEVECSPKTMPPDELKSLVDTLTESLTRESEGD